MMLSLVACGLKKPEDASNDKQGVSEDNSLQYILDKGTLVLGLDDNFPPMGFRDEEDNIVGFDIDLAQEVAKKLGVELVLEPVDWEAKEMELDTKSIDCIWNGFSITESRKEMLTLSIPYMSNSIAVVVMKDSDIKSLSDMAGKRLAIQGGSSAEDTLNSDKNKDFKATIKEVLSFGNYATALMDMETGGNDAVLMDSVVANYMINYLDKDYMILEETLKAEEYAIGFRKGELALAEAINDALREVKAEGTLAKISEKWLGEDFTVVE
ncbi:MAG: amino acid ABC transporter substrate-binding protein [Clostridiales bacterium]|nr:amino acid ABC transporter substrate-binding protein [Clostridiales bacterium]